jgi:hypothetical protein
MHFKLAAMHEQLGSSSRSTHNESCEACRIRPHFSHGGGQRSSRLMNNLSSSCWPLGLNQALLHSLFLTKKLAGGLRRPYTVEVFIDVTSAR